MHQLKNGDRANGASSKRSSIEFSKSDSSDRDGPVLRRQGIIPLLAHETSSLWVSKAASVIVGGLIQQLLILWLLTPFVEPNIHGTTPFDFFLSTFASLKVPEKLLSYITIWIVLTLTASFFSSVASRHLVASRRQLKLHARLFDATLPQRTRQVGGDWLSVPGSEIATAATAVKTVMAAASVVRSNLVAPGCSIYPSYLKQPEFRMVPLTRKANSDAAPYGTAIMSIASSSPDLVEPSRPPLPSDVDIRIDARLPDWTAKDLLTEDKDLVLQKFQRKAYPRYLTWKVLESTVTSLPAWSIPGTITLCHYFIVNNLRGSIGSLRFVAALLAMLATIVAGILGTWFATIQRDVTWMSAFLTFSLTDTSYGEGGGLSEGGHPIAGSSDDEEPKSEDSNNEEELEAKGFDVCLFESLILSLSFAVTVWWDIALGGLLPGSLRCPPAERSAWIMVTQLTRAVVLMLLVAVAQALVLPPEPDVSKLVREPGLPSDDFDAPCLRRTTLSFCAASASLLVAWAFRDVIVDAINVGQCGLTSTAAAQRSLIVALIGTPLLASVALLTRIWSGDQGNSETGATAAGAEQAGFWRRTQQRVTSIITLVCGTMTGWLWATCAAVSLQVLLGQPQPKFIAVAQFTVLAVTINEVVLLLGICAAHMEQLLSIRIGKLSTSQT